MQQHWSHISDEELVEGCREGNRLYQRWLYERFSPLMMAVCRRYAGDEQVAADYLQEGFIKVFTKMDQFRGDGVLEGWIRRIMVNTCLAHLRKQKRRPENEALEAAEYASVDATAVDSLSADELMALVESMPKGYRQVFCLYVIDGYEHKDIADLLGISPGTSKSQLARARTWLKKSLAARNITSYEIA